MKPQFLIIITISCTLLLNHSCTKETDTSKIHLLKIVKTTWEGSRDVAVYNYDNLNRLRDIKYKDYDKDFIEVFNYGPDGNLISFETDNERYSKSTYYYTADKIDYIIQSYTNNNNVPQNDTAIFSYNSEGKLTSLIYRNQYILNQSFYLCDDKGRLTMEVTMYNDSSWYTWSPEGNFTRRIDKHRNYETGGYNTYITDYIYDTHTNFFKAIPYPKQMLFLRSLSPGPRESVNNCLSSNLFNYLPLSTGPFVYSDFNSEGYPTKITAEETTYELLYGEY